MEAVVDAECVMRNANAEFSPIVFSFGKARDLTSLGGGACEAIGRGILGDV